MGGLFVRAGRHGASVVALICLVAVLSSAHTKEQSFATILKAWQSGITEPGTVIITSQADFQALWDRVFAPPFIKPDMPVIDFNQMMVVAVFQGEQSGGCYETSVLRLWRTGDRLRVVAREIVPGSQCLCTGGITQPFHMIVTEKRASVKVTVKQTERVCSGS